MPIVTIQQFPRSVEQKRELARRITQAYGADEASVQVFFSEVDGENWAKGGVMGCDRAPEGRGE